MEVIKDSTIGSGSRGGASRAGAGGGEGLGSVVCDGEEVSGWGVVEEVAVEGDEVLCTAWLCVARLCVVAGRWAAGLDPRVCDRRWGDVGLQAAVAEDRRPIRSPQEYAEFQLQRRSGSRFVKISGLRRYEERPKPRRPRWTMGRRRVACKPSPEERQ